MYKLYFSAGSCSLSPHIALTEVGAKYELVKVTMKDGKKSIPEGDFFKINPKGQVPTLQTEDGKILTEGAAIVQYIADKSPEKNLLPKAGTWERTKANEWLNYIATEIHKGLGGFFGIDRMVANKEGNAEWREAAKTAMGKKYDYLTEHLSANKFLLGNEFSAADAYLFTVLNWNVHVGIDLVKWPKLMGYMETVKSRPGVQTAMKAEGLI